MLIEHAIGQGYNRYSRCQWKHQSHQELVAGVVHLGYGDVADQHHRDALHHQGVNGENGIVVTPRERNLKVQTRTWEATA